MSVLLIIMELAGLFMALQPRIIACGNTIATFTMAVRFITGPAVMAAASIAVGLRGVLLHIAIVQVLVPLNTTKLGLILIPFYQFLSFPSSGCSSTRNSPVCLR